VIDPCCGSGSTLQAAWELGRNAYGFEVNKKFYEAAKSNMPCFQQEATLFDMAE
jgi:site-specific DNA-methyltransferase (adenine-specific)